MRRPREWHSVPTRCYCIGSSGSFPDLTLPPLQFLGARAVCANARSTPRFLEILPLQNFQRPINSESSFWWRFLADCDSSNNHQQPRAQVKQAHFSPREAPNLSSVALLPVLLQLRGQFIDCAHHGLHQLPQGGAGHHPEMAGNQGFRDTSNAPGHLILSGLDLENADYISPRSNSRKADRDIPFTTAPHSRLVSRMFSRMRSSPPELL